MQRCAMYFTVLLITITCALPATAQEEPPSLLKHWLPGTGLHPVNISIDVGEMVASDATPDSPDPETRLTEINEALAASEKRGVLLMKRAGAHLLLGNTDEASLDMVESRATLQREMAEDPSDSALVTAYALVCSQMGDEDAARATLSQALDADPTEAIYLAHLLPLVTEYDGALVQRSVDALQARLAEEPGDSKAVANLFMASMVRLGEPDRHERVRELANSGKYDEVAETIGFLRAFRAHQQAHPESAVARWWLAEAYIVTAQTGTQSLMAAAQYGSAGSPAAEFMAPAGPLLADVIGHSDASLSSYTALLVYHALRGEGAEVLTVVEGARQAFPDNETLPFLHAELVAQLGDGPAEARRMAEEAIQEIRTLEGVATLAWVTALDGDLSRAQELSSKLLTEAGDIPAAVARRAILVLGYISASINDYSGADKLVDQVLQVAPGLGAAVDKAIVLALLGDVDGAEDLLLEIAAANPADRASRAVLAELN